MEQTSLSFFTAHRNCTTSPPDTLMQSFAQVTGAPVYCLSGVGILTYGYAMLALMKTWNCTTVSWG